HQPSAETTFYFLGALSDGLGPRRHLDEITASDLAVYVAKRRAHLSNASVNRELECFRRVLRRASQVWGVQGLTINWRALLLPEPPGRDRHLSEDEERRLFQAVAEIRPDMEPLIRFAILSGVRLANAIGLTWADVDFTAGTIKFRVKSRRPGGDRHVLPISQGMLVLLANERTNHEGYVFTYEARHRRMGIGTRHPYTTTGWRKTWKRILEQAGIEDFRFHDLRHTAGTRILQATGNLALAQRLLGHKDISTTLRYAHVVMDDLRAGLAAVEQRHNNGRAHDAVTDKVLEKKGK
ncbi:MAG: site-specific integrase, partial [Rhodospirillales bacterium]|nr:site-specific integrase [Rhodospirillales bacterium]